MAALLEVRNLKKYFKSPGGTVHAVDDVSFEIEEGKTVGLVGESGCGKSTLGRTLIHLNESTEGTIVYKGKDVTHLNKKEMVAFRREVQMIFQDPFSSLDPRQTVSDIIKEPMLLSKSMSKAKAEERTEELMDTVGLGKDVRRLLHAGVLLHNDALRGSEPGRGCHPGNLQPGNVQERFLPE